MIYLPTYENTDEVIHPSVVDAGEFGFGGYRYWMASTPYPNHNDDFENPSLWGSDDKLHWEVPAALTNPIDPFPGGAVHNADAEICFASDGNTLYCYYIDTAVTGYRMLVRSIISDMTVGSETELFTGFYAASPTVIYDGSQYVMWYVDNENTSGRAIRYRTSASPDSGWSSESSASISGAPGAHPSVWNIHIRKLADNSFRGLFHFVPNGTTEGGAVYWATSADGISWTVDGTALFTTLQFSWVWNSMYRCCFLEVSAGVYDVWFSGFKSTPGGTLRIDRIGYKRVTV